VETGFWCLCATKGFSSLLFVLDREAVRRTCSFLCSSCQAALRDSGLGGMHPNAALDMEQPRVRYGFMCDTVSELRMASKVISL
jgi:hypothetical protein